MRFGYAEAARQVVEASPASLVAATVAAVPAAICALESVPLSTLDSVYLMMLFMRQAQWP